MAVPGLYRRILPSPPAIEFASSEGKQLFSEALQNGTMEGFFKLISYFQTQSEPAYCGLASLSMVLNALAIDPGRKWKGPWRWFDESMLDCCEPLEKVKAEGITFGKVACLAHCAGANVEAFRTNQSTLDDFRKHVIECTSSEDCHVITSYNRKVFNQTGTGHFSPIGGYHAGCDMALILDVARFKYPPHWIPLSLLWEAMESVDVSTGHPRGFMLISRFQRAPSLLYTLGSHYTRCSCMPCHLYKQKVELQIMGFLQSCRQESWVSTSKFLRDDVPILLKSEGLNSVPDVLSLVLKSLLAYAGDFIKWVVEVKQREEEDTGLSKEEKGRLTVKETVLQQVQETELFKYVADWLSSMRSCCPNAASLNHKDSLTEIAASVCCQGAMLLAGGLGQSKGFCCRETCVKSLKADGDESIPVVSGTVVSGGREQGVDMLIPVSRTKSSCCSSSPGNCVVVHPASDDVLTVLLLALPANTWAGIKEEKLLSEVLGLVSIERLPTVLQEEVLHLRRQLHFLRCKDKEVCNDLELSSGP